VVSVGSSHPPAVDSETVELTTADGLRLHGRFRRGESPSASVVVVHGFSASQDDSGVRALAEDLAAAGYHVLTYDARGHGKSEGWCGVGSTEHVDVACAVKAAQSMGLPVVLVGVSMGGVAVAGHLADIHDNGAQAVAGAVLVSTPSRWRTRISPLALITTLLTKTSLGRWVACRRLHVRIAPEWRTGEPLEELLRRVDMPLAVVHGAKDRLLAKEHGRRLQASAAGPCRLEIVEGMGHGIGVSSLPATVDAVGWVLNSLRETPTTTPAR